MINLPEEHKPSNERHPKCKGTYDAWNGDYNCGYDTEIDCKYGFGRKDPEAKCNQRAK